MPTFFKIILFLFFISGKDLLANDNIYLVENNEIIIESDNILDAREQAKKIAFNQAFIKLLKKIVPENEFDLFEKINFDQIETLVKDFRLRDEEFVNLNYKVFTDVNFNEKDVNILLRNYGIKLSNTISEEYLILPIHYHLNTFYMWEKNNRWYDALKKNYNKKNFLKLSFPKLNILNKFKISVKEALDGDINSLNNILQEYDKKSLLIIYFKEKYDLQKESFINSVSLMVYSDNKFDKIKIINNELKLLNSKSSIIDYISKLTINELQNWWKNKTSILEIENDKLFQFDVIFEINSINNSLRLEKSLRNISMIKDIIPRVFSKKEIKYTLFSFGNLNKLKLALKAANIRIEQTVGANLFKINNID